MTRQQNYQRLIKSWVQHIHLKKENNSAAKVGWDLLRLPTPTPAYSRSPRAQAIAHFSSKDPKDEDTALSGPDPSLSSLKSRVFFMGKWNFPCFSLSPLPHVMSETRPQSQRPPHLAHSSARERLCLKFVVARLQEMLCLGSGQHKLLLWLQRKW